MKAMTLNTHSWFEENQEEKLRQIGERILKEDYDVIALQEVNQRLKAEITIPDERYCPADDMAIREDNFALLLVDYLRENGADYYWTWTFSHITYSIAEEGLAILSKQPLEGNSCLVSLYDQKESYRRRVFLTGLTEVNGQKVLVCSGHYSWWGQYDFIPEWQNTEKFLQDNPYPLIIMGDFNNPAGTPGYSLVKDSELNLTDTFAAEDRTGSYTVDKNILGWEDNAKKIRIDFIFVNQALRPTKFRVIFDGENSPVVSDHYGVDSELAFV